MRLAVIVLSLLFASFATAQEIWHVVEPVGLGFAVELPGHPVVEEQKVDIGDGKSATMRTWQILSPPAIYDITVAEYPQGMVESAKLEQHLDNARDGALASAIGPLISETKIELAGRPARELLFDMTMGMNSRTRIVFNGDRLYSVGAITKKGEERSPGIERFFASFKFTGSPKP